MNFSSKLLWGVFLLLSLSCKDNKHLFSEQSEWQTVVRDFENKQAEMPDGNLFGVFSRSMTTEEKEALMFLYAYMPIGDITDYTGEYYLTNIRYSFRAKEEMPW